MAVFFFPLVTSKTFLHRYCWCRYCKWKMFLQKFLLFLIICYVPSELSKSLGCPELGGHVAATISLYLVSVWIWALPLAELRGWCTAGWSLRGPLINTPPWPRCLLIACWCRDSYRYFWKINKIPLNASSWEKVTQENNAETFLLRECHKTGRVWHLKLYTAFFTQGISSSNLHYSNFEGNIRYIC